MQIGKCVAVWWRPNFETIMYPYCPPHITKPKLIKISSHLLIIRWDRVVSGDGTDGQNLIFILLLNVFKLFVGSTTVMVIHTC